jgi:hypothetical protein
MLQRGSQVLAEIAQESRGGSMIEAREALRNVVDSLMNADSASTAAEFNRHLESGLRSLSDVVTLRSLKPTDFSPEVMPVILQLLRMSRMIELNTSPRGKTR